MVFHEVSRECLNWMEKQSNVKEESLTDWLLYEVSKKTNKFCYHAFKRNEEATIGADWEWWVLTTDSQGRIGAFRFLIQAKKLWRGRDNYPLISYSNKNGMQIDLLLEEARKRNAIPLYMYYSVGKPELIEQIKFFSDIPPGILEWCRECKNGAFFAMADHVKDNIFDSPRRKVKETELLNKSLKLSLCDLLFKKPESGDEIMTAISRYYVTYMRNKFNQDIRGNYFSGRSIPGYVYAVFEQQNQSEGAEWIEREYFRDLQNLSGVAVLFVQADRYR